MEVTWEGPCAVASIVWRKPSGSWAQTIICKLTFLLRPGEAELFEPMEPIHETDVPWPGAPAFGLYAPADLAPFKPHADVILIGHAYAPGDAGPPLPSFAPNDNERSFVARLDVAGVDKVITLSGEQPRVTELAPLPAASATRQAELGTFAGRWPDEGWNLQPIPEDISPAFFNVAPEDQRTVALRDDQHIRLTYLHPELPFLTSRLPGVRPVARLERPGVPSEGVKMTPDTLWIDTDRSVCTLTFRGRVGLDLPEDEGCIRVQVAKAGEALRWTSTSLPKPVLSESAPPPASKEEDDAASLKATLPLTAPSPGDLPRAPRVPRPPPLPPPRSKPAEVDVAQALAIDPPVTPAAQDAKPSVKPAPPRPAPKPAPKREVLSLLWFDAAALPRIRRIPAWKKLILDLKPRPSDDDFDGGLAPDVMKAAKDKRDVFGVLARGEALDAAGIKKAIDLAVADDGSFVSPHVLTGGVLELPFDEVEQLRAMRLVASPFLRGDKKLREAVEHVDEVLATKGIERARGAAIAMMAKLDDAFENVNRGLPAGYLRAEAEPLLLEGRCWVKRDGHVRGTLAIDAIQGADKPVPVLLPEAAGAELPAVRRLDVRVIVEADHAMALRVAAVAQRRS